MQWNGQEWNVGKEDSIKGRIELVRVEADALLRLCE